MIVVDWEKKVDPLLLLLHTTIFENYNNSKFANYLCIPFFFPH